MNEPTRYFATIYQMNLDCRSTATTTMATPIEVFRTDDPAYQEMRRLAEAMEKLEKMMDLEIDVIRLRNARPHDTRITIDFKRGTFKDYYADSLPAVIEQAWKEQGK